MMDSFVSVSPVEPDQFQANYDRSTHTRKHFFDKQLFWPLCSFQAHCCYSTRNPSHLSDNFLLIYVRIPDTEQSCRQVNSRSETQFGVFLSLSVLFLLFLASQLSSSSGGGRKHKADLAFEGAGGQDAAPGRALNLPAKVAVRCAKQRTTTTATISLSYRVFSLFFVLLVEHLISFIHLFIHWAEFNYIRSCKQKLMMPASQPTRETVSGLT